MQKYQPLQQLPSIQRSLTQKSKSTPAIKFNKSSLKNPQLQFLKLPSIYSKLSSSNEAADRNTKSKVQKLEQKIKQLRGQVNNTRLKTKQALNNIHLIDETLNTQLATIKEDLKKQIKTVNKFGHSLKESYEERSKTIRQDCKVLWDKSQQIWQKLYELKLRTEGLERAMGFRYGA